MTSLALKRAVHRSPFASASGLLERLFTLWFARLVYTQIWEDPRVDREALALTPESRVVAIASAGCNALAYLADDPATIDVVDLNPAHLALTRLKIAAMRHLPDHESVIRFLGAADEVDNETLYFRHLSPQLDEATRSFGRVAVFSPARGSRSSPAACTGTAPPGASSARCIGSATGWDSGRRRSWKPPRSKSSGRSSPARWRRCSRRSSPA